MLGKIPVNVNHSIPTLTTSQKLKTPQFTKPITSYYQGRVAHWVSGIVLSLKVPSLKPAMLSQVLDFLIRLQVKLEKNYVKREILLTIFNLGFYQSEL